MKTLYEFSNRRGYEGINIHKDDSNHIISNLFSDIGIMDENKLNSYVHKNFIGIDIEQQINSINASEKHPLKGYIDYCRLSDLIDFSSHKFEKVINLKAKKKIESKYRLEKLGATCCLYQPEIISKKRMFDSGEYKVYGANGVIGRYDQYNHKDAEVVIACRGTCGTVNFTEPMSWITGNAMVASPKNKDSLNKQFLYNLRSVRVFLLTYWFSEALFSVFINFG